MKVFPISHTLDSNGNGSIQFIARKASIEVIMHKITVEMDTTSSGRVNLYKNGAFQTSMPVSSKMEAYGPESLHTSEYLTGEIVNGPVNTLVSWNFYYDERPTTP